MTFDKIVEQMQADDWPIEHVGERAFRCRFEGVDRTYSLLVHVEAVYLLLLVLPLVKLPSTEPVAQTLMDRLLELNSELVMAKFSVDEDADVILSIEFPVAEMEPGQLQEALDVLVYYTNKYAPEIIELASTEEADDDYWWERDRKVSG